MSATQSGVESQQEVTEVFVGNKAREDLFADIVRKTDEARKEEMGLTSEEEASVEEPENIVEVTEESPEPEPKKEEPPAEEMVTLTVDGEQRTVTKKSVEEAGIRALQKESAADKRLAEATRLLNEAKAMVPKPATQKQEAPELNEVQIAELIRNGTDQEATAAVKALSGRQQATPEEIAAVATKQALDQLDFQQSAAWFVNEYKDIATDPYLSQLAAAEEDRLRAAGDQRPRKELYKSIGDGLRKWRGGTTSEGTSSSKQEKKATITNLPSASARKVAPEQPKPQSASDIVEEMRKARGQR